MTTVVFGIQIFLHKIEFITVSSFPSLNVIIENKDPITILPYSKEASPGETWEFEKVYQLIYIIDAFEKCDSCPITFELVSPVETTALGKCTLELKPLICDSIAAHGYSPIASQTNYFRDFEKNRVASFTFDIRTVLFQMCLRTAAEVVSNVHDVPRSKRSHALGKSGSSSDINVNNLISLVKQSSSYRNITTFAINNDIKPEKRRKSFADQKANTSFIQSHKGTTTSKIANFGNIFD